MTPTTKPTVAERLKALAATIEPWRVLDHGYMPVSAELLAIADEVERVAREMRGRFANPGELAAALAPEEK